MSIPPEVFGRATNEALKPISWLIGRWKAESGKGIFPTIQPFQYAEEIEFTSLGQPLLNYKSISWNPITKVPMHFESGFLRINPGSSKLAFLVAHNFGVTTHEEGEVEDKFVIKLETVNVSRMSFAKDPSVLKTQRTLTLVNGCLEQVLMMETSTQPLTEHLRITYNKVE